MLLQERHMWICRSHFLHKSEPLLPDIPAMDYSGLYAELDVVALTPIEHDIKIQRVLTWWNLQILVESDPDEVAEMTFVRDATIEDLLRAKQAFGGR